MKKNIKFCAMVFLYTMIFLNARFARADVPSLPLKDSIKIAEEALTGGKFALSNYYLYSITYAHSNKGDYWYCVWRSKENSEYNEIFVKVYMNSETDVTTSRSKQAGY